MCLTPRQKMHTASFCPRLCCRRANGATEALDDPAFDLNYDASMTLDDAIKQICAGENRG